MRRRAPVAIGQRYDMLRVVANAGAKGGHRLWLCVCDCGGEKKSRTVDLTTGKNKSCGCLSRPHGLSLSPEHGVWTHMKRRCYAKHHKTYANYGGRGITICERWLRPRQGFKNFYADMGPRPSPKHEIDRVDNNGPYAPENCRWVLRKANSRNRRTNRLLAYAGRTLCVAEWCEITGLRPGTLYSRIYHGWSLARALSEPADQRRGRP